MALSVILLLYVTIGVLAAAGSITISSRLLPGKWEQVFYGLLLLPIANFYLAFSAYFGDTAAWEVEAQAVMIFAALGLVGLRVPAVLILGYALHGLWDLVHELQAHAMLDAGGIGPYTQIPLAYGAFCATFDWCMAVYFFRRRSEWNAGWRARET